MALKPGPATQGKAIHNSKPSSKLAQHKYVTKPESREIGTKVGSADKASSILRKVF